MEQRILLRHLSASKANQVEEFPLGRYPKLTVGRDPSCEIKYDPEREDLVSRLHAAIVVDKSEPLEVSISDLGSRNGTFVNKQRIATPVKLMAGDVIQLGAGGPEFQFDLDPRPQNLVRATRIAAAPEVPARPTREGQPIPAVVGTAAAAPAPAQVPGAVGRATVERLIVAQSKAQTRRIMILGLLALVVVLAVVGGLLLMRKPAPNAPSGLSPTQVAAANTDSVVFFEVGWKLMDMESGRQLNQVYAANAVKNEKGEVTQRVPGAGEMLPVFVVLGSDQLEPMLSTNDAGGKNKAVGGRHSGSGFVVSPDGFILTNRHVAATWHTSYDFPDPAGLAVVLDDNLNVKQAIAIPAARFPKWVPANAKFILEGSFDASAVRIVGKASRGKNVEGRNDYLDVTFAKNRLRVPAKIARVSDRIDVAMVKIDLPQSLRKVDLNDNYDTVKPGDAALVMGYPAVSPDVVGVVTSRDPFNPEMSARVIPDPTLSVGNVGRVLRGQAGLTEAAYFGGDMYQLTVNSTGAGNSGGPVFDDQGRVIGILTMIRKTDAMISFAVPIRYGMELMGTQRVIR